MYMKGVGNKCVNISKICFWENVSEVLGIWQYSIVVGDVGCGGWGYLVVKFSRID